MFKDTVANGGTVRLINVNGYADKFPRKEIDKLGEFVKTYRAKGLAWMKLVADGSMTSSFAKFLSEDEIAASWFFLKIVCAGDFLSAGLFAAS